MPKTTYIKVSVDDQELDLTSLEEVPVSISYKLEDKDDFQKKSGSNALNIKIPSTINNDKVSNSFHNPTIEDLTTDQVYRNFRRGKIEAHGNELLVGKALLNSASHSNKPTGYEYDFFGNNADWKIDIQEKTLFDVLSFITFTFSKANIISSWYFDGTVEALPYVFAPVRYRDPMGGFSGSDAIDDNMTPSYMKPSLSKYWIIYWAFKSIGYKISSDFFNSSFFRRQVMPWTWGNFLDSDGTRLSTHNFLAKSTRDFYFDAPSGRSDFYWDLDVSNDNNDGAFDNNNDYQYNGGSQEMQWQYKPQHFGILDATFSIQVMVKAGLNGSTSDMSLDVFWYVNGVNASVTNLVNLGGTLIGGNSDIGIKEAFFTAQVNDTDNAGAGTIITAKVHLSVYAAKLGYASITASVLQFQLDYFKIPLGGTIDFQNYTGFKKVKFLDLLRGVIDEFDLSIQTDSIQKVVKIEPTHPYSLIQDQSVRSGGYFNGDFIDWSDKQDISIDSKLDNFSDNEREMLFKYKNDENDGILKVIQDRIITTVASGKYVLPSRFKAGRKEVENRFFAPTMHYEADQWKGIGTGDNVDIAPQLICLIPENISNTSRSESGNTFTPKSCYYKGLVTGAGAWKFDGDVLQEYPFMFSVNYKEGGENDPILSYSDEKIKHGSGYIVGVGLLRRFYWQRMAIMREGKYYSTRFRLQNNDIANWFHREHIICSGCKWELVEINNYQPMKDDSTACFLRKWTPIALVDNANTYPAEATVLNGTTPASDSFDLKYSQLKCLISDIPTV